ncbi:hypothetical protein CCR75_000982 [Bremia lactucae]|uniref:Uncharacterized protein n=1 Tax=Bremia lactucae TaxID=4779 RepID=A0A976IHI1_BRELC|nr:hypothetical protein CCR75_000982 [Bremia lactucae]
MRLKDSWVVKLEPQGPTFGTSGLVGHANFHFRRITTDRRASMASSSLTNHLKRKSHSTALNLEISIFKLSGRRGSVSTLEAFTMLLSQQFQLLSTLVSPHLRVLVKQGYFITGHVEFVFNELGYGRMLFISSQSVPHDANGWPACDRTHSFDRSPFKLT